MLSGRVKASLAVTGGVHDARDAIKAIMAGADAVQMVSALLLRGPKALAEVRDRRHAVAGGARVRIARPDEGQHEPPLVPGPRGLRARELRARPPELQADGARRDLRPIRRGGTGGEIRSSLDDARSFPDSPSGRRPRGRRSRPHARSSCLCPGADARRGSRTRRRSLPPRDAARHVLRVHAGRPEGELGRRGANSSSGRRAARSPVRSSPASSRRSSTSASSAISKS